MTSCFLFLTGTLNATVCTPLVVLLYAMLTLGSSKGLMSSGIWSGE